MSEATREVLNTIAKVLLRCWIVGVVLQLLTFGGVLYMGGVVHYFHETLFGLSNHESDLIIAGYLSLLKLFVGVVFFIPWLAIWLLLIQTKKVRIER